MTNWEKYVEYCQDNAHCQADFYHGICQLFNVSYDTALNIWYVPQRSWFRAEMIDELIRLDDPTEVGFRPNLCSGEFGWDEKENKFTDDPTSRRKDNELCQEQV